MEETKKCKYCGQDKPLSDFAPDKRSKDGLAHTCNCCKRKQALAEQQKKENPLAQYSPVELMKELARRGYDGTLTVTERRTVLLSTLLK